VSAAAAAAWAMTAPRAARQPAFPPPLALELLVPPVNLGRTPLHQWALSGAGVSLLGALLARCRPLHCDSGMLTHQPACLDGFWIHSIVEGCAQVGSGPQRLG